MVSDSLKVVQIGFMAHYMSVYINILCVLEKNIYYIAFLCKALYNSIKWSLVVVFFQYFMFLVTFWLSYLNSPLWL